MAGCIKPSFLWSIITFCIGFFLVPQVSLAQECQYCKVYKESCEQSLLFFAEYKPEFEKRTEQYEIASKFAYAIVAPEVANYSFLQDLAETSAVELFYVNFESGYADFSVGHFQMKLSFIEQLEKELQSNSTLKKYRSLFSYSASDIKTTRKERLERMHSTEWQIDYLFLFCEIMEQKFSSVAFESQEEQLKFYATAYNTGFYKTEKSIRFQMEQRLFPGVYFEQRFAYCNVSLLFYRNL